LNRDRLSSIDLLQVKKLKEHVYQKILKLDEQTNTNDSTINSNNNNNNIDGSFQQKQSTNNLNGSSLIGNDLSSTANRTIELICSDTVFIFFFCILFYENKKFFVYNSY
jgi:hypothetical protein